MRIKRKRERETETERRKDEAMRGKIVEEEIESVTFEK